MKDKGRHNRKRKKGFDDNLCNGNQVCTDLGKRGSRRHSTTSFSKNVEVAEKSYQMLEVLSFCDRERV